MYANFNTPVRIHAEEIDFSVDVSRLPYWQMRSAKKSRFSGLDLADEIVQRALRIRSDE